MKVQLLLVFLCVTAANAADVAIPPTPRVYDPVTESAAYAKIDRNIWKEISTGDNIVCFYKKNIIHEKGGIIAFWSRYLMNTPGAEQFSNLFADYPKIAEVNILSQVNCKLQKYRQLTFHTADKDGIMLNTTRNSQKDAEWDYVVPDSITSTIVTELCSQKSKKK